MEIESGSGVQGRATGHSADRFRPTAHGWSKEERK